LLILPLNCRKNLGWSAETTTKAMQDLASLQSRQPDIINRINVAMDAYNSGSTSSIQKIMALRAQLRSLGLGYQDIKKIYKHGCTTR